MYRLLVQRTLQFHAVLFLAYITDIYTGCGIKSSPLGRFLSNGLEFQRKILYTYIDIICIYTCINRIKLSRTVLKLSASQQCHLVILAHSKNFSTKTRARKPFHSFKMTIFSLHLMIAPCPRQVWWSSVDATLRTVRRKYPTPQNWTARMYDIVNNSAAECADCSILLKFGTEFGHMMPEVLQTFKIKGSKVKVTA